MHRIARMRSALVALVLAAAVGALSVGTTTASAKHLPLPTPGGGCSSNC